MSVVELKGHKVRELRPGFGFFSEPSQSVLNRGKNKQVLLFQSQFFAYISGIIWIKDRSDIFSVLSLLQSFEVISLIETTEVELLVGQTPPKSKVY